MQIELSKDCLITGPLGYFAAGTVAETFAAAIDMDANGGYDGCLFVALLGTVSDSAVSSLEVYESATNVVTGGTEVTGALATHTDAGAGADSNGLLIVDVIRPKSRYLYATLTRTVANVVICGVIAIRYRGRTVPAVLDATVLASALSTPEV